MITPKPEQIEWIDSFTNDAESWKDIGSLDKNPPKMMSFGHVIDHGDFICVVPNLGLEEEHCCVMGEVYIPKVAIVKRTPL